MFNKVREAYELLIDSDLRKQYDFTYKPEKSAVSPEPPQSKTKTGTTKGKNLRYNLYIRLEDVANGCERSIRYIRNNNSEKETVQIKVAVPKGAFDKQRLKLSGYGDIDKQATGDLFVIIHLQEHPLFIRRDINLRVNVPIRYLDAVLGSTIEIPTLKGLRKLKLRGCEFDKMDYTLKGFGLPDPKGNYRGDLEVHCFIDNPSRLSQSERNSLQKIANSWPQPEMMKQYQDSIKSMKGK